MSGDSTDLGMLAATFTGPDLRIEHRAQEWLISSAEFDHLSSAGEVRDRAREIVTALSGSARLILGARRSLDLGSVYRVRDDGKRDITLLAEPAVMHVRVLPVTLIVTTREGDSEVRRPADPIAEWLALAHRDPLVAKALRLRNEDSLNWVDLYRIYEVIQSDVGDAQIVERGWLTRARLSLFTRTANSVTAAGDAARHGRERTEPPRHPLSLPEGRALVDSLLLAWLNWRLSHVSGSE